MFTIQENSFDQGDFLKNEYNSPDIYHVKPKDVIYSPFSLHSHTLKTSVVLDYIRDPVYTGIEFHILKDEHDNEGIVVLLYQKKNIIDLYFSPQISLDTLLLYKLECNPGNNAYKTDIEYSFDSHTGGIKSYLKFIEKNNRSIECEIDVNAPDLRPVNILAPAGDRVHTPLFFPFFYLKQTVFLPCEYTNINFTIGGEERKCPQLGMPVNGIPVLFGSYSLEPVMGMWNINNNDELTPVPKNGDSIIHDTICYGITRNNNYYEITSISTKSAHNEITIHFSPPVPELVCLKKDSEIRGRFAGEIDGTTGIIGGTYLIKNKDNKIDMNIKPHLGWQPYPGKLWCEKYSCDTVIIPGDNRVMINSQWKKTL